MLSDFSFDRLLLSIHSNRPNRIFKRWKCKIPKNTSAESIEWQKIEKQLTPYLENYMLTPAQLTELIQFYFSSDGFRAMQPVAFEKKEAFYKATQRIVNLINDTYFQGGHSAYSKDYIKTHKEYIIFQCRQIDWFIYYGVSRQLNLFSKTDEPPQAFIKNIAIKIDKQYTFNNSPYAPDENLNIDKKKSRSFLGSNKAIQKFLSFFRAPSNDRRKKVEINHRYTLNNSLYSPEDSSSDDEQKSRSFIGRDKIVQKFLAFLCGPGKDGKKKGVYLITGYRGMGKTSFVNNVIHQYQKYAEKKKHPKVIDINISLAQKQPSELDILRLMVAHLYDKADEVPAKPKRYFNFLHGAKKECLIKSGYSILTFVLLLYLGIILQRLLIAPGDNAQQSLNPKNKVILHQEKKFNNSETYDLVIPDDKGNESHDTPIYQIKPDLQRLVIVLLCLVLLIIFLIILGKIWPQTAIPPKKQLEDLLKRCYTSYSLEKNEGAEFSFEQLGAKIAGGSNKETINFPIASSKEIEYELIKYLRKISYQAEFIFVFDELDKIEPAAITTNYFNDTDAGEDKHGAYLEQIRERKQAIISIIAGLKNFLTTAEARFVFIAGREMFDATLADVSDRQSSVGSIFNYVFYVQSFLRESLDKEALSRGSMGQMIESYMIKMIIDKNHFDEEKNLYELVYQQFFTQRMGFLQELQTLNDFDTTVSAMYNQRCSGFAAWFQDIKNALQDEQRELNYTVMKVMITLQDFVNYLTYRSNGSPKKIIKALHEFVRIKSAEYNPTEIMVTDVGTAPWTSNAFLYFNFKNQYRIGFINHLYRPFIIKNGESFKKYSDNIIISTTYLFDHLLKFHPFAFSFANLELIPEVLSTSKTPSLRDHIITIIDYLSNNHLRETENGIFDYKFYSRTVNELIFLSKTFEEESAAFNFTLDEGFLVKLHVRNELRELRKVYSAFNKPQDALNSAFSITHLNGILGDLHFFDQEYDDAIVAYSNAVNELRHEAARLSITDFVVLIRFLLKSGLTFEKVKNYDEALAFYSDAAEEAENFIMKRLKTGKYIGVGTERTAELPGANTSGNAAETPENDREKLLHQQKYQNSMLSDLLQIVNQAFIAKIVLQEKMGVEGITSVKFGLAIGSFFRLSHQVAIVNGRNYIINANLYVVLGNLLYFKNSYKGFELDRLEHTAEGRAFYHAYEPNELYKLFVLRDRFETFVSSGQKEEKRTPTLSFFYYVIGITEIVRSRLPLDQSLDFLFHSTNQQIKDNINAGSRSEASNDNLDIRHYANLGYAQSANLIYEVLTFFNQPYFQKSEAFTKTHYKYLAIFTSHIGDCLLSMLEVPGKRDNGYKNYLLEDIFDQRKFGTGSRSKIKKFEKDKDFTDFLADTTPHNERPVIVDVLRCYYQSAEFFKKRGRMVSYSFQLRKILYTLRLVLKDLQNSSATTITRGNLFDAGKVRFREQCMRKIEQWVLQPILETAGYTADNSDRYTISKFENLFDQKLGPQFNAKEQKAYILNNISSHPDSREAMSLFMYIQLKLIKKGDAAPAEFDRFINPYNASATQYTRLYEIGFWAKLNNVRLNSLSITTVQQISAVQDQAASYAREYLFALFSQAQTIEIYGMDYMISHSLKGYIHYHIGDFLTHDVYKVLAVASLDEIKKYFGHTIKGSLADPYYHYAMAKKHYEKTLQLHKVGAEYIKNLDNIVYLEDDINDNAYHFGAALDRFLMTNGTIALLIKKCEKKMDILKGENYSKKAYLAM